MKYKVGNKVIVVRVSRVIDINNCFFEKCIGKIATILEVERDYYMLNLRNTEIGGTMWFENEIRKATNEEIMKDNI
jgi:hypothetical protein